MSILLNFLQKINIIKIIIYIIGTILYKINGLNKIESFNSIVSLILIQSKNFLYYKNNINKISKQQIFIMSISYITTIPIIILSLYIIFIPIKYVIISLLLNIFNTFIIIHIINPINLNNNYKFQYINKNKYYFLKNLKNNIKDSIKISIIISIIILLFISLINFINSIIYYFIKINLNNIFGYIFSPITWIIGIPLKDNFLASNIIANKLILNEFIALIYLNKNIKKLSNLSVKILYVFLTSFSNIFSINIIFFNIYNLNIKIYKIIYKNKIKLFYISILINLMSSFIAGYIL